MFEFGIITSGDSNRVDHVIQSIMNLGISDPFGITVIGAYHPRQPWPTLNIIPFDESIKNKWITKKKNLITWHARFQNVVYTHDYLQFEPDWYTGWKQFLTEMPDFKVAMNKIINTDGSRYRDWTLCPCNTLENARNAHGIPTIKNLLPYHEHSLSKGQYISGAYWVAKKQVMIECPLDESLVWGEGEDMLWSHQVRHKYDFSMNPYSTVKIFTGNKHRAFEELSQEEVDKIKNYIQVNGIGDGYGMAPRHYPPYCETKF